MGSQDESLGAITAEHRQATGTYKCALNVVVGRSSLGANERQKQQINSVAFGPTSPDLVYFAAGRKVSLASDRSVFLIVEHDVLQRSVATI